MDLRQTKKEAPQQSSINVLNLGVMCRLTQKQLPVDIAHIMWVSCDRKCCSVLLEFSGFTASGKSSSFWCFCTWCTRGGGGGVRRRQTVLCVGPDAGGPSPASHSVHAYDAVLASHSPLCLLLCCRTDAVQHSDAKGHPVLYLTSLEAPQHCISKSRLGPWWGSCCPLFLHLWGCWWGQGGCPNPSPSPHHRSCLLSWTHHRRVVSQGE